MGDVIAFMEGESSFGDEGRDGHALELPTLSIEGSSRRVSDTMVILSLDVICSFLVITAGTHPHVDVGERSQTCAPGSIFRIY